ncbi:MAG: hypothetical protein AB7V50_06240 [Vampirovibrionia bacterium]
MVIPAPRVFPKCPKCDSTNHTTQNTTFKKVAALIVYCESCGAILGIINDTSKDKK